MRRAILALGAVAVLVGTWVAVSAWRADPVAANEAHAVKTLAMVFTTTTCYAGTNYTDQDGNGVGELGWLGEQAGIDVMRDIRVTCSTTPFIPRWLGEKDATGRVTGSGYHFRLWMPTAAGRARREPPNGGPDVVSAADAPHQERRFVCYAWPVVRGQTGTRAFAVTHLNEVLATDAAARPYSGDVEPAPDAAFREGAAPLNLDAPAGSPDTTSACRDGNIWRPTGARGTPCRSWIGPSPTSAAPR